jgi:hypothetical protein
MYGGREDVQFTVSFGVTNRHICRSELQNQVPSKIRFRFRTRATVI